MEMVEEEEERKLGVVLPSMLQTPWLNQKRHSLENSPKVAICMYRYIAKSSSLLGSESMYVKQKTAGRERFPRSSKQRGLVCRSSFEGMVRAYLRMYSYGLTAFRKSRLFTYRTEGRNYKKYRLEHVEEEAKRLSSTRLTHQRLRDATAHPKSSTICGVSGRHMHAYRCMESD